MCFVNNKKFYMCLLKPCHQLVFYFKCDLIYNVIEQDHFLHNNQSINISENICLLFDFFLSIMSHCLYEHCGRTAARVQYARLTALITSMWCWKSSNNVMPLQFLFDFDNMWVIIIIIINNNFVLYCNGSGYSIIAIFQHQLYFALKLVISVSLYYMYL